MDIKSSFACIYGSFVGLWWRMAPHTPSILGNVCIHLCGYLSSFAVMQGFLAFWRVCGGGWRPGFCGFEIVCGYD